MESEGIPFSYVCLTQTASIMISLSHQNVVFVKTELILAPYHPDGYGLHQDLLLALSIP